MSNEERGKTEDKNLKTNCCYVWGYEMRTKQDFKTVHISDYDNDFAGI